MRARRLDPARPYKPLDFGNGIVSGTVSAGGRILSLGIAHPRHGRVVLTDMEAFPDELRRDQAAVRRYRARLADPRREGFGLAIAAAGGDASLVDERWPLGIVRSAGGATVEVLTLAPPGRAGVLQRAWITAGDVPVARPGRLTGEPLLARAAYPQLTEGGPLPPVAPGTLGAAWCARAAGPDLIAPGERAEVLLAVALGPSDQAARDEADRILGAAAEALSGTDNAGPPVDGAAPSRRHGDVIVERALSYCLDCAASALGDGIVALMADHEILPLVWTRDAYYVARALLVLRPDDPRARNAIAGFLRWLFERAERPGGWWPRSSLASGAVKDPQFQLDQQLYPLLLALDADRHRNEARRALDRLLGRRGRLGLIATMETPADDPLGLPYHFSSHVLLWHVLDRFGHPDADRLRADTVSHFTRDGRFAYAVGEGDAARHYHDANDLPTVFAPGWRFCAVDDPVWRATIDFAWSAANEGYVSGALAGLGSVHTLHPWPLGDLQDLVVARLVGEARRADGAASRLDAVATWDDLLPEAYDERTGAVASRHHFAWPNALRALLLSDPTRVVP